jgi:hypothetical protein
MKFGKQSGSDSLDERLERLTHEERKAVIQAAMENPRTAPTIKKLLDKAMDMAKKHVKKEGWQEGRSSVMMHGYYFLRHELNIPKEELNLRLQLTPHEKDMFAFADQILKKS